MIDDASVRRRGERDSRSPAAASTPTVTFARAVRRVLLSERADAVGLGIALLALCAALTHESPYFLSASNFSAIGLAISISAVVASVQTVVLVSGGLDLSITAVLALSGVVAESTLQRGAPLAVAVLAGLAVGVVVGLVNSVLIVGIGVNAFIATIGTQFLFRGIAYIWTNGSSGAYLSGTSFNYIGGGRLLGVRFPIVLMFLTLVLTWFLMRYTRFGSRVYAVGGSEYATKLAGVSIWRLRTLIYVLSGVSAALGGLMLASLNGASFPQAGIGEELTIIGAVLLGGTALTGGRGTVFGTFLGVCLLGVLANGLNLLGINGFWQTFLQGAILVCAVAFDEIRRKLRAR